jgi:hypothetical protein
LANGKKQWAKIESFVDKLIANCTLPTASLNIAAKYC